MEIRLNDFERSFPQLFFAAYLGVLPNSICVSELGFWLLNHGAFETPSLSRRNDFGLLVVIDPASKHVSLTVGYALEEFFQHERVLKVLRTAAKSLSHGAFATAITSICEGCCQVLRKKGRRTVWTPAPALGSESLGKLGLEALRGGHRTAARPVAGAERNPI